MTSSSASAYGAFSGNDIEAFGTVAKLYGGRVTEIVSVTREAGRAIGKSKKPSNLCRLDLDQTVRPKT